MSSLKRSVDTFIFKKVDTGLPFLRSFHIPVSSCEDVVEV